MNLYRQLKGATPFFLIAGPCVIESEEISLRIAKRLVKIGQEVDIPVVFKASFDKANRQHVSSFRGPGITKGLEILQKIKQETGLSIITDVHETSQIAQVAQVADIIQIPAFLCRQTDLIVAAAESKRIVNIKKGQMCSAQTMQHAANKVTSIEGNAGVILTERGSMFGYNDLIVDPRNLVRMRNDHALIVQDVTHSVQQPGALGNSSGGLTEFIPTIARMAAAVGVHGFFFETHENPSEALSDSATMWPLDQLKPLLLELKEISMVSKGMRS